MPGKYTNNVIINIWTLFWEYGVYRLYFHAYFIKCFADAFTDRWQIKGKKNE